ncbi:hypothetical protein KP77_04370 [Jeotgalibacillus alimentarius]|uniref:HTH tetR-type domain-containing protein n=1 Tax=Jeotgalibacillus alimentarius TaxID=135826 RepID=A0A0C2WA57_9BACL|nr:TetR/AcrR family transcriptional regulator [Jeotgalibacillus alimentarius]KIL53461.1 hypothetical protein KP77_04370 [Jeotgalibacillus alimentarius]
MIKQKPINANSKRSISLIVNAMLELLKNDSFKSITISQITQQAGVVRNTFYAHFKTKEDVLSHYIFDIFSNKFNSLAEKDDLLEFDIIELYFDVWVEHSGFLNLLKNNNLLRILNRFETHLDIFCFESYIFEGTCSFSKKSTKYAAAFYAHAMAGILNKWIATGMKENSKELADVFHELGS